MWAKTAAVVTRSWAMSVARSRRRTASLRWVNEYERMRTPVHGASLSTATGSESRFSTGVLVLYHEQFRHPVSLTARTSEGAECFPILCSLLGPLCHAKGAGAIMAEEMWRIDDAAAETRQEQS